MLKKATFTKATLTSFLLSALAHAAPITYQGELTDTGVPADGMYDMVFTLADQAIGGFALQAVVLNDVEVNNGLFEAELDFDDVHFTGDDRWIDVRVEGVILSPRSKITHSPYAIRARSAQQSDLALDLQVPWVKVDPQQIIDATSTRETAISGRASSVIGENPGVYGQSDSRSAGALGVHGVISDLSPGFFSAGVYGENRGVSTAGFGVYGTHAGAGFGVYGRAEDGYGVFGTSPSNTGVSGTSQTGTGLFAFTNSGSEAIHAQIATGDRALFAEHLGFGTQAILASENYGLEAHNISSPGNGKGLYAEGGSTGIEAVADAIGSGGGSLTRIGVNARAGAPTAIANEVYGVFTEAIGRSDEGGNTAYGLYAKAQVGDILNTAYGVYSEVSGPQSQPPFQNKYAGYFVGDVHVVGTLSKSSGSFKIDHPMDPENKYLSHSFVESPEMLNVYSGVVTLDEHGAAVVALPDYFESLNTDCRYQLTAIGAAMPELHVSVEVEGNTFGIDGGIAGKRVSWEVSGVRQDPSALYRPIETETDKAPHHRGLYLDPEAHGYSKERAIHKSGHTPN